LNRRFLGVDYGRKRTGLSLCDPDGKLAWPLDTLTFRGLDDLAARLSKRAKAEEAVGIVLGLPRRLDGTPGDLEPEIEDLAARLRSRGHPVILWDEHLTSWAAQEALRHAPQRVRRSKGVVDAVAAAILLQSYLESL
jgi:putative Holliday junction resolvase